MRHLLISLFLFTVSTVAPAASLEPIGGRYVIDVRTEKEWTAGHVEGAALIPHEQIADRIAGVVADKDAPIALYCRSGRRSGIAMESLKKLGYTNVVNYGGFGEASKRIAACKVAPNDC